MERAAFLEHLAKR